MYTLAIYAMLLATLIDSNLGIHRVVIEDDLITTPTLSIMDVTIVVHMSISF